jgi:type IX secretion system PorP/SprF family membrane protein
MDGGMRASVSYRNQWFSTSPFTTYCASIDKKVNATKNAAIGVGMVFFRDIAGDNRFVNSEGKIVISSVLNILKKQKVSIGVGGGFLQKNIDQLNGTWNTQYIAGKYDPTAPSFESLNTANNIKGDISVGATYFYGLAGGNQRKQEPVQLTLGFGVNHLLAPSFKGFIFTGDKLSRNIVVHGEAKIKLIKSNSLLIPGYFMQFQGPFSEIVFGTQYRHSLKSASQVTGFKKSAYINLGAHVRFKDAFITSLGFQLDKYSIGMSYDWNVNTLRQINRVNGAFEINLLYQMNASRKDSFRNPSFR